jgi:hypothetical protein
MFIARQCSRLAVAGLICAALHAADTDFAAAVAATRPVAYYRLDATQGKSQTGSTEYKPSGGVTSDAPGPLAGVANGHFAKLDGRGGYILTTQAGGVGAAASMMAWVNLAALPSAEGHFFYVVGESQNGNDLDLQFETDNALRFYTASGGHLSYAPSPTTLLNQWHLMVATMDAVSQTRVIYWDGKPVATDKGGGRAGKTGTFSIGASTVFGGRFFKGGIAEAALWNRALTAGEVAAVYTASKAAAAPAPSGPFATTAKVEVADENGKVALKREEQIAILFLAAIQMIEGDCQMNAKRACALDQVLGRLKFDPKVDPNYTYTLAASGLAWEAHANAKRPGLAGFCLMSRSYPQVIVTYNPAGTAGFVDKELADRSIEGDSFQAR